MKYLLQLSRWIDAANNIIGKSLLWLVLLAVLIAAFNAISRKLYDFIQIDLFRSSNAFLEIQWYLYAAVFLGGAGYTLLHKGHVNIDVLLGRFARATQVKIEILGLIFFLLPFCYTVCIEIWPTLYNSYITNETSENAGGLIRWPVYAIIPIGFSLLAIQGISEIIKRAAFLLGAAPDPKQA